MKKGYHKMPNGKMMKDSDHKSVEAMMCGGKVHKKSYGGKVKKMKSGGMCRGMGAATQGGNFKLS